VETSFSNAAIESLPFQSRVEREMKQLVQLGGYEAIYLFNPEGLVLAASVAREAILREEQAVEFSVLIARMQKVVRRISELSDLKEQVIEDQEGKRLVFRFLKLFSQPALLLMVLPASRSYRGLANRLCRIIEQYSLT